MGFKSNEKILKNKKKINKIFKVFSSKNLNNSLFFLEILSLTENTIYSSILMNVLLRGKALFSIPIFDDFSQYKLLEEKFFENKKNKKEILKFIEEKCFLKLS